MALPVLFGSNKKSSLRSCLLRRIAMPEHPKFEGPMKIAIASDHAGFPLKEEAREYSSLRTLTSA
jgi:hypothetical protein